ncbi:MAG: helix-turn-helix domain-containing protein [Novosphingobium sp.]
MDANDIANGIRQLTPRQRERRERIQMATFSLLVRHGGEALSMRMIAEAAGVAERTLFNIYGSKDRLFAFNARERSEETIAQAHEEGGEGIGFFAALPSRLAEKTFEAPELARAFGPILVEHADMVGLPDVYERFAGGALTAMRAEGLVAIDDIATVSRFVCMRMVGTIVLWAKREIPDDALETHLRLAICQVLLPYAEVPLFGQLRDQARALTRTLGKVATPA